MFKTVKTISVPPSPYFAPLIELQNISKYFVRGSAKLCALQNISLCIETGKTLGIVGESGCGKSTLGRVMLRLEEASSGDVFFQGKSLKNLSQSELRSLRRHMQMVFQDPYSSLNPMLTIEQIIGEGLEIHQLGTKAERKELMEDLVKKVGLDPQILMRFPHEFSGGQRQRIAIARALAVSPLFVVCDEAISSLDTYTQRQVMELFLRLKHERQLTYAFISHDLHAVKKIADQVAVMYCGHLVEFAPAEHIFSAPAHPYTEALLAAVPCTDPIKEKARKRLTLLGDPPSPYQMPQGCPFQSRCPKVTSICREVNPVLQECGGSEGHFVACHKAT
jgi:oligopeptide/dipeptide ABC transporter ATP-binding protein